MARIPQFDFSTVEDDVSTPRGRSKAVIFLYNHFV